ncbi:DNA helicase [Tanacetum coccineum]|uniref:ATP-dependent DNA helicase n=1 Tax=Tanacetum coccineum TaxID=301880 RepID=A0ABQ4WTH6_9ASTR
MTKSPAAAERGIKEQQDYNIAQDQSECGSAEPLRDRGDEAPMNDSRCFEALDRTLKDLMNTPGILFGGKTIILGGDFCQTLPVKKSASKSEPVAASIAESYLWWHFKVCTLTENMRLQRPGMSESEQEKSHSFAKWLLSIGNGEPGEREEQDDGDTSWISIPTEYCVLDDETGMSELIDFIYDQETLKTPTTGCLQEKAIVCPKTVDLINARILLAVKGRSKIYLSNDEAIPLEGDISEIELLYLMEYLNTMNFLGFPRHELELKVGSPIMLLRNVNLLGGLYSTEMLETTIASLGIRQHNRTLEAKVYRKWISKSVSDMREIFFCYMLIDRETIWVAQDQLATYISLQLPAKEKIARRKVDIENLEGNIIEFTMWDEMVRTITDLQLSATFATHYYINPRRLEAEHLHTALRAKFSVIPSPQVAKYRFEDPEMEKTRNRETLHTLLQQNPTSFKGICFTCEVTITGIRENREWHYTSCN